MANPVQTAQADRTANEVWLDRARRSADQIAFRHRKGGAWTTVTWGEAERRAQALAGGLVAQGLQPGERVCILSQTRWEWVIADVAILKAGGVPVAIYPSNTAEQCAYIIRDSGSRLVVAEDAAQVEKVLPLVSELPGLRIVHIEGDVTLDRPDARGRREVKLSDITDAHPGATRALTSWTDLMTAGRSWLAANATALDLRTRAVQPDDTFTLIYTSGTTGVPKGVVLTHRNLIVACESGIRAFDLTSTDEQYLFLPLAHVLGREMEWVPVVVGLCTAFSSGLSQIKEELVEVRPTFMVGVPRIFEKFYSGVQAAAKQGSFLKVALVRWGFQVGNRHAAALRAGRPSSGWAFRLAERLVLSALRTKLGLDRCRFLISGGAPLAAEIADFFHGVGLLILEGYGLTETTSAIFINRPDRFRFGTVGPALDVVEHKFADDGEILVRGPSIFGHYHNNPAATAESVDGEGWFHTGDIGEMEDEFLRITDRKKDLIVTAGGKKIAPQMLENAIKAHSTVLSQVMVYGDKRPYCVALVTLSEEAVKRFGDGGTAAASAALKQLVKQEIDAVNAGLASYESVKSFAILPREFSEAAGELTPSMKVKRKVVVERYKAEIEALYLPTARAPGP